MALNKMGSATLIGYLLIFGASVALTKSLDKEYDNFKGVESALPFPGSIEFSSGSTYRVVVNASQDIIDALNIRTDDDTLKLDIKSNVDSSSDAIFQIWAPASSIKEIKLLGIGELNVSGDVIDDDETLDIEVKGTGSLTLSNVTVTKIDAKSKGEGNILVSGSPEKVEVEGRGAGQVYLLGVTEKVEVKLYGAGGVHIEGDDGLDITGKVYGISTVEYTAGNCDVDSTNPTVEPCTHVDTFNIDM